MNPPPEYNGPLDPDTLLPPEPRKPKRRNYVGTRGGFGIRGVNGKSGFRHNMQDVMGMSLVQFQRFLHKSTPCGQAWIALRGEMIPRDRRGVKGWVFATGWIAAIRWTTAIIRLHNEDLAKRILDSHNNLENTIKKRSRFDIVEE